MSLEMERGLVTRSAGWSRDARLLDRVFAPFTTAVLTAADLDSANSVLVVGCGTGTLLDAVLAWGRGRGSSEPARAIRSPRVAGVDSSMSIVEAARTRVPGAVVARADAQTADFSRTFGGQRFDRVISRFEVAYFDDPAAVFANLRTITAPGGRLAFLCWRAEAADMFLHGLRRLAARLDPPPAPPAPGTPGPLGLADAGHIRQVLTDAGWAGVSVQPVNGWCDYCLDGSDGVEERLGMALNGHVGEAVRRGLEDRSGPAAWNELLDDARAELRERLVDGGVRFVGQTWLVTATNP